MSTHSSSTETNKMTFREELGSIDEQDSVSAGERLVVAALLGLAEDGTRFELENIPTLESDQTSSLSLRSAVEPRSHSPLSDIEGDFSDEIHNIVKPSFLVLLEPNTSLSNLFCFKDLNEPSRESAKSPFLILSAPIMPSYPTVQNEQEKSVTFSTIQSAPVVVQHAQAHKSLADSSTTGPVYSINLDQANGIKAFESYSQSPRNHGPSQLHKEYATSDSTKNSSTPSKLMLMTARTRKPETKVPILEHLRRIVTRKDHKSQDKTTTSFHLQSQSNHSPRYTLHSPRSIGSSTKTLNSKKTGSQNYLKRALESNRERRETKKEAKKVRFTESDLSLRF